MTAATSETSCAAHVGRLREQVNAALAGLVPDVHPVSLYEPVRFVLAGEGKRFRPVLLLLSSEIFGAAVERALPAALAVEVFHNFTLVHDDIMDHAAERRGRPTVHVRWDESTAILSGDYLMGLSYDLLARVETERLAPLVRTFSQMVAQLCEGQMLDKEFETRDDVTVDAYLHMIDRKTGALLRASIEMGGIIGGAGEGERAVLREMGQHLGRAFQIQDDLLDLVAEDERWGKAIGGDLMEGKKTFLLLRSLERTDGDEHAWFARIVRERGLPAIHVAEARERMERSGVIVEAREAVRRHSAMALQCLERLPPKPAVLTLRWLVERMQARLH